MARTHRAYPPECRQQTVELVQPGRAPDEGARGYDESLEQIKTIWQLYRDGYSRPRIHTDPLPGGERVSPKRVGRLTRRADIEGAGRARSTTTTTANERAPCMAPDLAVGAETELRRIVAPQAEIEEPRCCVQAPDQADKRSRAPTHEPCTGQEHAQAKRSYKLRHEPPPGIL